MSEASSSLYLQEYHVDLASQWDDLMGWKDREKAEGPFLADFLKTNGVTRVLDAATGTGFHSVLLAKAGFDVVAIDGAPEMVEVAKQNIEKRFDGTIPCTVGDWLQKETLPTGPFDAVICLGNSLAHLFSIGDLQQTLGNFRSVLRDGGVLVLDQRNYDGILAGKVSGKSKSYCCTGLRAEIDVSILNCDTVQITYTTTGHQPNSIRTHAWRLSQMAQAISEAGFLRHRMFGERGQDYAPNSSEFVIHTAVVGST